MKSGPDVTHFEETETGAIASGPAGKLELDIIPSRTPGLVLMRITHMKRSGKTYYQFIELDAERGKHVSSVMFQEAAAAAAVAEKSEAA